MIVFAPINWFPFLSLIKKERKSFYKNKVGTKIIDGVTVIYKKRLSFSNILSDSKINLNGISYYYTIRKKIKKILKKEEVLFIDAHMFKIEGYVASLLHKKFGIPSIVTCHGTSLLKTLQNKNCKYIASKIINNINYAVCVSDLLSNKLRSVGFNNVKTIYNGINSYRDSKEKKIVERDIIILTVATLIKRKNVDLVIESFKRIYDRYSDAKLFIIGEGIEKENLESKAQQLKIAGNVKFLGQLDNKSVYEYMQRSKIFLLPSINEGFGIVYAEAMYNGCFTIGTRNEGIDGFIKNEINGFLVNPNIKEIVGKINYILDNESKLQNIRKKAIDDASNLSWENNAKEYINLINNLERNNERKDY